MKAKALVFTLLSSFVILCTAFTRGGLGLYNYGDTDSVKFIKPINFPDPVYDFKNNPVTANGFKLGRILFYDPILSKDKSISCANCHQSFAAFANLDHPVSHGVDNCMGTRNAPPLFNLAWQKDFMWDGGVHHIELSPMNALTSHCEMDGDLNDLVSRLRSDPNYPKLFKAAFGSMEINTQGLFRALAQFSGMLISANSKYDKMIRNLPGSAFNADEAAGYALFKKNCSECHKEPLFTDLTFRSNGLKIASEDIGRDSITHQEADKGKFRVPSLRNVELTSPYMHDGSLETLEQVMQHYASGIKNAKNLDPLFRHSDQLGFALTPVDQRQLIAFLKTLTDKEFVNDPRFQAPAKSQENDDQAILLNTADPLMISYQSIQTALKAGDSKLAMDKAKIFLLEIEKLQCKGQTSEINGILLKIQFDARHISEINILMHQREHFESLTRNFKLLNKKSAIKNN